MNARTFAQQACRALLESVFSQLLKTHFKRQMLLPAALLIGTPFAEGASLQWLGATTSSGSPVVVSGDGSTVAFVDGSNVTRWTNAGGSVSLPFGSLPTVRGLSTNGSVMTGSVGSSSYRWDTINGFQSLAVASVFTNNQFATGISGDGNVIVGHENEGGSCCNSMVWVNSNDLAFTSRAAYVEGVASPLPGGAYYVPTNISTDGNVIVGYNNNAGTQGASIWTYNPAVGYELRNINTEPGASLADVATAVSGDGSIVVGGALNPGATPAWYWTDATGVILMQAGIYEITTPLDINDAGSRLIGLGYDNATGITSALVWNGVSSAPRTLDDLLTQDYGIDLGGYHLERATSISADGNTIVGFGRANTLGSGYEAFIVQLSPVPEADTWAMVLVGLGLVGVAARRHKLDRAVC